MKIKISQINLLNYKMLVINLMPSISIHCDTKVSLREQGLSSL